MLLIAMRYIRNIHGEMIVTWTLDGDMHVVTVQFDDEMESICHETLSASSAGCMYLEVGGPNNPLSGYEVLGEEVGCPDVLSDARNALLLSA